MHWTMCVNNLSKVALDSAAAGIEPAISSRKSNALTTTPPSHTNTSNALVSLTFGKETRLQVPPKAGVSHRYHTATTSETHNVISWT